MNIDPLAEKSRKFSPYAYALDNLIFLFTQTGWRQHHLIDISIIDQVKILGQDGA